MKKITATKRDLVVLLRGLLDVQELPGKKLGTAVAHNIKVLEVELQDIEAMGTINPQFVTIANEINRLVKEEKNEEASTLEKENEALLDERREQLAKIEVALNNEGKVSLKTVLRKDLPATISGKQIYHITSLLKD
tara:strand:- start:956 stop:1363 length:408 start_codon:yes stop_codon:yes gene_type:complete